MKKLFRIASIFLFLASFIGCKPDVEVKTKTGSIQGKVIYENENVTDYSGIQVTLFSTNGLMATDYCVSRGIATNARSTESIQTTNSNGEYFFENVPEGVYTIYASSNSSTKKAVATNVVVRASETVTAEILGLTATGSISGKITIDGTTDGVLGLDVFIAGTSFIAKVGSDGNYEISNIPAKTGYVLCVQKGEKTKIIAESVEVKGDESSSVGIYDISSDGWISEYIKWLGAYENEPENPALFEAYLNTKDGCLYIWDGTSWDLLGQGGSEEEGTYKQITCTPVEEGIKFEVRYPKEMIELENQRSIICITDIDNNVTMKKTFYSMPTDNWVLFTFVYPLVEKGKEYNFTVELMNAGIVIDFKKFNVTAIGGMGEYKVENVDELEVTLTEDKVLSVTPQDFTNNQNVPVIDYGINYEFYSNNDTVATIWEGIWLFGISAWENTIGLDFDLTKIYEISRWRDYSYMESALKGRRLGVKTQSIIKIAGYTYNDTVYFEMNDLKQTFFDWDKEDVSKVFVMYGYDLKDYDLGDSVYIFDDVPGVEKYYVLETNKGYSFVEEGTKNAKEVYGKFFEVGQNIEDPIYIPDFSDTEIDLSSYKFTGEWYSNLGGTLPYAVVDIVTSYTGREGDKIDGYQCVFLQPEIERIKTLANFYDESGENLIYSFECRRDSFGYFSLSLPSTPVKEGFVGYWVDEDGYGNWFTGDLIDVSDPVNNFYLRYKERIFSSSDLYYVDQGVKILEFNIETGKSYQITWADSYEGSSEVRNLLTETGNSSSNLSNVRVTAYDDSGNYYITEIDSGFSNPLYFKASESGLLYLIVDSYADDEGFFALSVKEVSEFEHFNVVIDLRGKTVMNTEPFEGAWMGGFVTSFDTIDISEFNELIVDVIFYDEYYERIETNWGLGQFFLLKDANESWDGDNCLATQYNLGMENIDLSTLSGSVTGIAFLTSSDEVKYIQITSIQFVK